MKILSPWPWPQGHPRGGDGADKNFRPCDGKTNERTYERTNVRTNQRTDERKSENYIPSHTSYVGGIINITQLSEYNWLQ